MTDSIPGYYVESECSQQDSDTQTPGHGCRLGNSSSNSILTAELVILAINIFSFSFVSFHCARFVFCFLVCGWGGGGGGGGGEWGGCVRACVCMKERQTAREMGGWMVVGVAFIIYPFSWFRVKVLCACEEQAL